MSPDDALALRRWLVMQVVRFAGFAGAVFGLVLVARGEAFAPRLLGIAIVLSAFFVIATVPSALAHRWRTPRESGE